MVFPLHISKCKAEYSGKRDSGKRDGSERVGGRRGYTLVELLIVIVIVALLAAILFPAFARARENARRSSCQSNLKQISLGAMQYIQDYDERFPLGITTEGGGVYANSFDLLQPYLKDTRVGNCPSDSEPPSVDLHLPGSKPVSYAANVKITTAPFLGESSPPSMAQVGQSSRLPLIWDATNVSMDPVPDVKVARRHLEGANCLFADGHVKWIRDRPELWDISRGIDYWDAAPGME